MKKLIGDLGAALQFMQTGIRQIDKNASLFPSSPFLVDAMVKAAPLDHAKCVVEFGPGTGVVTKGILKAMPKGAHLHAIELDGELLKTTTRLMQDDRLRSHHGSAADAVAILKADGCTHGAQVVFSSLGLSIMPDDLRESILDGARQVLTSDGIFVQYQYVHGKAITYQFGHGWSRFDGRKFLGHYFHHVTSKVVIPNAPPAIVYKCTEPLKTPKKFNAAAKDASRARRRNKATATRRR
jgi:phospholipid N-methyltransferase